MGCRRIVGAALLVLVASCSRAPGGKGYLLEQMHVNIQPPAGWEEVYDKTWGSLQFVKSDDTEMRLFSYCLNCDQQSYPQIVEEKIQSELAILAEQKPARLKKKETPKPGVQTYLIEAGDGLIVGAHHFQKGVMGILSCEARLATPDRDLLAEVQKRCADLVITAKK